MTSGIRLAAVLTALTLTLSNLPASAPKAPGRSAPAGKSTATSEVQELVCTAVVSTPPEESGPAFQPADHQEIVSPTDAGAKVIAHDGASVKVKPSAVRLPVGIGLTALSAKELPTLDPGMTNVTGKTRAGVRFTPHPMQFAEPVEISMPYDPTMITDGFTAQDVYTYFFDELGSCWKPLYRVRVDEVQHVVVSYVDHFTDMINALVMAPEQPEGGSFNPNQIKGIQVGDPASRVNLIGAPMMSNQGDNRLTYPIEVPPGRNGTEPDLALVYDSAKGNGWMGMGWDLGAPAITIDTRWGVPRYEDATETETYLLNGEQLTPLAHRSAPPPRTAEKVFHTRTEGGFARIVRHGSTPVDYTWEVTDRSGAVWVYGSGADGRLTDRDGNVYLWMLQEMRDTNGNVIRYRYAKVDDAGTQGAQEPGSNIYLQRISYAGRAGSEGRYTVTFIRDRELAEPLRVDKQIDARGGFKRVTADLLRKVEVALDGGLIRRYEFTYTTGAFFKSLLASVKQFDANGTPFNTHTFDYFDEIRDGTGAYQAFQPLPWTSPDDGLNKGELNLTGVDAGRASAINANTSTGGGGHLYTGFGTIPSKSNSIGLKTGFSFSDEDGLLALVDVDGDSLPDKVFRDDGATWYRKNLSGPKGQPRFDTTPRRLTLPGILDENSSTVNLGIESYFGVAAQLNFVNTFATTSQYFTDVNGDEVMDLVNGSSVLFGRLGADGVPVYGISGDTPVPIGAGTVNPGGLFGDFAAERERFIDSFPLLDTVRRWVAPFDGQVEIQGAVRLATPSATGDGVRVAIQHEDSELWSAQIGPQDTAERVPAGVSAVNVTRGQRLYFRVQSLFDGANDVVSWDPVVTYRNLPSGTDANGLDTHRFRASRDFTLGGRTAQVAMPLNGTVRFTGNVTKLGPTTDDVTVVITADGLPIYQRMLVSSLAGVADIDFTRAVRAGQVIKWRLETSSPIDLGQFRWTPRVHYTAAEGVERVNDPQGNPLIAFNPPYETDMYPVNDLTAPQGFFHANATAEVPVDPRLTFSFSEGDPVWGKVTFTVKARGVMRGKATFIIEDGVVTSPGVIDLPFHAGDDLFFDFSTPDPAIRDAIVSHTVDAGGIRVPSAFHSTATEDAFPQPYRGWAAIGYNGNRARANAPIAQADLVVDDDFFTQLPGTLDPQAQRDAFAADPRVNPPKATPFLPDPGNDRWGAGDRSWVSRDSASSSRLGTPSIQTPRTADVAGIGVPRMSRSQQVSLTGGIGLPVGSVGGSVATGDSTGQLDYLDLNGDMFPDAVGANGIQYSEMFGGLGATRGVLPDGAVRKSSNVSGNANAGSAARTLSTGRGNAAPTAQSPANTSRSGNDMPPLGVGGGLGTSTSDGTFDLLDVNGDGLPDRVHADGRVALNLGYSFGRAEPWRNAGELNDGSGNNFGVNIGFNTDFYGFAGGASYSEGNSSTAISLIDVNGDGLMDRVFAGTPMRVGLNTGNGFEPPVPFHGSLGQIAADRNASLGGGAYFTIPICFLLITLCLIINPGGDFSTGASRSETSLRDINGDGYADHLASSRDSELTVASNKTGRTNLLRGVSRPLGARMEFDYARDGNDFGQPQSHWVLTRYTVNDGRPGDGPDVQLVTYEYAGGKYNRLEREFFGYGTVTERHRDTGNGEAIYRSVVREFRTDSHYTRGLVQRETSLDSAGRPFMQTEHTYALRDVATGAAADANSTTATVFTNLARTDRRYFEGQANPAKSDTATMEYDEFGNMTRNVELADAGPEDDLDTQVGYTASDPACRERNIIGTARTMRVVGNGTVMRDRESTVDCVTGNVTQARAKLADGSVATTDLTYFDDGNLRSATAPPNRHGQRYRMDYTYDTVVQTYLQSITDSFGYRSTSTHNLKFGLLESTTDFNNQTVRYTYDTVGRMVRVVGPYEAALNQVTIAFEYHPEAPVPYAVTRHIDREANGTARADTMDTVMFVDGLKRVLQTKQDASLHNGPDVAPAASMVVSGRTVFDFLGRPVRQHYPTSEPKGAGNTTFNPAFDSVQPTVTQYDILDRTVRLTYPDNTVSTVSYGFGPDRAGVTRFEQVTTDANGKSKRTYRDTRQLTTAIKEFNPAGGQPVIWTSYAFDALGQATAATDDRNNVTRVTYDNFGRRTLVDNPDAGRIRTDYDLADNLIRKANAKLAAQGLAVEYDYDFNRMRGIRYPLFQANNVSYTYGPPGAPNNGASRVTAVSDGAGTVTREYGPLGEVVKETRATTIQGGQSRSFTTQYRFDSWNRTLSMTYPDGEVLTYRYDSGGKLDSATGVKGQFTYQYLQRMDYDKFGQQVMQVTGNGTKTTYAYDAADRRLANLKANLANGYEFQDLQYQYDDVGNLTSIRNDIPVPSTNVVGGPVTQTFSYDDIYRLTHAEGSYSPRTPGTDRYRADFTYDSIHNITRKSQTHENVKNGNVQTIGKTTYNYSYAYASGKPHAASTIGPFTVAYDPSGNQISREQQPRPRRQMIWDEENRLACSHENVQSQTLPQTPASCDNAGGTPNNARYKYDDQGERVVKDGSQFHLYPNRNFSTRGNHEFKHIYIGESKLLTKIVEPQQREEDRQYYSHADHLGSTAHVTDERGELSEHLQYFPGGETWVSEHPSQPVPHQFTGKEFDPETNLYYFGARYYDPRTQAWQTPDPVVEVLLEAHPNGGAFHPANLALYTYGYNHPINLTDPMGMPDWKTRAWGAVKLVGGVLEAGAGVAAGAATSWTGVGAVVGAAVAVHGFDVAYAGARQLISGEETSTFTSQTLQRAGVSKDKAEFIDGAISVVGTLGASGVVRGAAAGASRAAAPASRVPSQFIEGRAWEKLMLARFGLKPNYQVLRPTKDEVGSKLFQIIVGRPEFTKKKLEFVGTRFDSMTGGLWEIKSGTEVLELTGRVGYQLRLQVYFAVTRGQQMTLISGAPIAAEVEQFLVRFGVKIIRVTKVPGPQ